MSEYNVTRNEKLLSSVASGNPSGIDPITREEMFLSYIAGESATKPKPITRKEKLLDKIGASGNGGGAKPEQEKTVNITENGTTEVVPDEGNTLSKVTVNTSVIDGEIGKPYIDTSKITEYNDFFSGNARLELLDRIDTSNGTKFNNMFYNCTRLYKVPQLDTSNGTLFNSMFYNCSNITEVPELDIINGTRFDAMFYECKKLETVALTTATVNLGEITFKNCTALQNITIGEGWAVNIYLHYSNNLTVESLHGMIENLADLTGQTAKIFQIGATNLAKIDEDHIAMLEAKNWNYS